MIEPNLARIYSINVTLRAGICQLVELTRENPKCPFSFPNQNTRNQVGLYESELIISLPSQVRACSGSINKSVWTRYRTGLGSNFQEAPIQFPWTFSHEQSHENMYCSVEHALQQENLSCHAHSSGKTKRRQQQENLTSLFRLNLTWFQ